MVSRNNNSVLNYLTRHWRGEFSLLYAFTVNFIAISLCVYGLLRLLQFTLSAHPEPLFYLSILLFVLYWFSIFPWQSIGVIRSSEKNPAGLRNTLWILPIQATTIFSTIPFFTGGTSLVQTGFSLQHQEDPRFMEIFFGDPEYQLSVDTIQQVLTIDGLFDNGLTADLRQRLAQYANINTVHLNSLGGSIYEARGVAQLIIEQQWDTVVTQECSSSCTTAFVAGGKRTLLPGAKLGFHQYRLEATYAMPNQQKSINKAQQKDLAFFRTRGLSHEFLDKVFQTSHDEMWYPEHSELLTAGVINATQENR